MTIYQLGSTGGCPFGRVWSQVPRHNGMFPRQRDRLEEFDECETWEALPGAVALAEPGRKRWTLTFIVIALLLAAFAFITFWGLTRSDWLYGTFGQISQTQWDQITDVRDRLVQLGVAPDAVAALNNALLLPRPSTEDVLFDLRKAALALERIEASANVRAIEIEIHAFIGHIEASDNSLPTLWPMPTPEPTRIPVPEMGAPLVQGYDGLLNPLPQCS